MPRAQRERGESLCLWCLASESALKQEKPISQWGLKWISVVTFGVRDEITSPRASGSVWHFEGWQWDKCSKIQVHEKLLFNALERGCHRTEVGEGLDRQAGARRARGLSIPQGWGGSSARVSTRALPALLLWREQGSAWSPLWSYLCFIVPLCYHILGSHTCEQEWETRNLSNKQNNRRQPAPSNLLSTDTPSAPQLWLELFRTLCSSALQEFGIGFQNPIRATFFPLFHHSHLC